MIEIQLKMKHSVSFGGGKGRSNEQTANTLDRKNRTSPALCSAPPTPLQKRGCCGMCSPPMGLSRSRTISWSSSERKRERSLLRRLANCQPMAQLRESAVSRLPVSTLVVHALPELAPPFIGCGEDRSGLKARNAQPREDDDDRAKQRIDVIPLDHVCLLRWEIGEGQPAIAAHRLGTARGSHSGDGARHTPALPRPCGSSTRRA